MGWYSKHIMGGDSPEDAKSYIMNHIGYGYDRYKDDEDFNGSFDDETVKEIGRLLTREQKVLFAWAFPNVHSKDKEKWVRMQVLAVCMVNNGATIQDDIRAEFIKALQKDHWAKCSAERKIYIKDFIKILENYDDTPTNETLDYEKQFGVTYKDWMHGRNSSKIALMALHYIHQGYKHHSWYKDSTIVCSAHGYAILIGVNDMDVISELIADLEPLFEVPIYFADGAEMQYVSDDRVDKVKYYGDINYVGPITQN